MGLQLTNQKLFSQFVWLISSSNMTDVAWSKAVTQVTSRTVDSRQLKAMRIIILTVNCMHGRIHHKLQLFLELAIFAFTCLVKLLFPILSKIVKIISDFVYASCSHAGERLWPSWTRVI